MKYIKCNLVGEQVEFKIVLKSINIRNNLYTLQLKYKFRPYQIFSYCIDNFDEVYSLDEYKTMSDKELTNKVKSDIVRDILRRTAFKRKI